MYKFIYTYYQDHYDKTIRQVKETSYLIHSLVFSKAENNNTRLTRGRRKKQSIFKELPKIKKNIPTLREAFILDHRNHILAHSDILLVGKKVVDIYPDFERKVGKGTAEPDIFKYLPNLELEKRIEYKYFYKYVLPKKIKYPIYTINTNIEGNSHLRKDLFLVFDVEPPLIFNWINILVGLMVITYVSFFMAFSFEKTFRVFSYRKRFMKEPNAVKTGTKKRRNQLDYTRASLHPSGYEADDYEMKEKVFEEFNFNANIKMDEDAPKPDKIIKETILSSEGMQLTKIEKSEEAEEANMKRPEKADPALPSRQANDDKIPEAIPLD